VQKAMQLVDLIQLPVAVVVVDDIAFVDNNVVVFALVVVLAIAASCLYSHPYHPQVH
jgi:hypothetical protein